MAWGFAAAAVACVVSDGDPDDTGATTAPSTESASTSDGPNPMACTEEHNVIIGDQCFCEENYEFCEPNDPNDFSCCGSDPPNPSTTTPSTETDASTTDVDPTDADTTAGDTDGPTPPDPADCTVDTPDVIFCTNTEAMGPEGSAYFVCTDGEWVESPNAADELCQFDGYDFAYGCIDDGSAVAFICGNGTGTACENADDAMCIDMDEIDTCIFGRATQDSCATICSTIGDEDGVTYDGGFCDTEAKQAECICCDDGECP